MSGRSSASALVGAILQQCSVHDIERALRAKRVFDELDEAAKVEARLRRASRVARRAARRLRREVRRMLESRETQTARPEPKALNLKQDLEKEELRLLKKALASSNSLSEAARTLGVVRSQFYRMMDRYGVAEQRAKRSVGRSTETQGITSG